MATRRTTAKASKMTTQTTNGRHVKKVSPLEISDDDVHNPQRINDDDGVDDPPSTIEERYRAERERAKLRHWKESEHAAGLVEPTWSDEMENYRRRGNCNAKCCAETCGNVAKEEIDPGCGCTYLSAALCSRLGAGRIGNMAVLKERYVVVEVDDDDDETAEEGGGREEADGFVDEEEPASLHQRGGGAAKPNDGDENDSAKKKKRTVRRREIQLVVGPFWPMLLFITYPLIFGVSLLTLHKGIPGKPVYVQIGWALMTGQLIRSLFNTGFRDPGILARHREPPPIDEDELDENGGDRPRRRMGLRWGNEEGPWRWSDQAQSYRPRNSMYCPDCKVVIEEFDHTCPWTGTAIGKRNMASFQMFVGLVFVCLIVDIFLLTSGAM